MGYKFLIGLHVKNKEDADKFKKMMSNYIRYKDSIRYAYGEQFTSSLSGYISRNIDSYMFSIDKIKVLNLPEMIIEDLDIRDCLINNVIIIGLMYKKFGCDIFVNACGKISSDDIYIEEYSVLPLYYKDKILVNGYGDNIIKIEDKEQKIELKFFIDVDSGEYCIKLKDFIADGSLSVKKNENLYQSHICMSRLKINELLYGLQRINNSLFVYKTVCMVTISDDTDTRLIIPNDVEKVLITYYIYRSTHKIDLVFPPTVNEIDFGGIEDVRYLNQWVRFIFSSNVKLNLLESLYYKDRKTYDCFPDLESILKEFNNLGMKVDFYE